MRNEVNRTKIKIKEKKNFIELALILSKIVTITSDGGIKIHWIRLIKPGMLKNIIIQLLAIHETEAEQEEENIKF